MKKTVFLLAVIACAGVLAFLQLNLQNEAAYAPRSASQAEPAADASGMEEILLALRGDVETGEMNHEGLLALGERTRQVAAVQSTSRASAQYWNPWVRTMGWTHPVHPRRERIPVVHGRRQWRTVAFLEQG